MTSADDLRIYAMLSDFLYPQCLGRRWPIEMLLYLKETFYVSTL